MAGPETRQKEETLVFGKVMYYLKPLKRGLLKTRSLNESKVERRN